MRIATLLPSATEIVCALGAQDDLVGVSHACDFPASIAHLPRLTTPHGRFVEAHQADLPAPWALSLRRLAVFAIDATALADCSPDLIITQRRGQRDEERELGMLDLQTGLGEARVKLIDLQPTRLDHIWEDIEIVAAAIGRDAGPLLTDIRARIAAVRAKVAGARRPSVVSIEWLSPVVVGGNWMPELLRLAGGEPLATEPGERSPTLTDAGLATLDPDVVLIKPCALDLARVHLEAPRIAVLAGLFPRARIYLCDGNAYFNHSGPRIIDSIELAASALHPDRFGLDPRLIWVQG